MEAIIIEEVEKLSGMGLEVITSNTRKVEVIIWRQLLHTLLKKHTGLSLAQIGSAYGDKDHATVLNSIAKTKARVDTDSAFRSTYNYIETILIGDSSSFYGAITGLIAKTPRDSNSMGKLNVAIEAILEAIKPLNPESKLKPLDLDKEAEYVATMDYSYKEKQRAASVEENERTRERKDNFIYNAF